LGNGQWREKLPGSPQLQDPTGSFLRWFLPMEMEKHQGGSALRDAALGKVGTILGGKQPMDNGDGEYAASGKRRLPWSAP
tara:strand:+ start:2104 stop:2343 length:240 start_codon:yes stop_codon:yes gene_type:complete